MTWTINISGTDDLTGDEKIAYETELVETVKTTLAPLVAELAAKEGGRLIGAKVYTNTSGEVNLMEVPTA